MKIHQGYQINLADDFVVIDSVVTEGGPQGNIFISLEESFDCDPDGSVSIIPKNMYDVFKKSFMIFCEENEKYFNFSNGAYGESYAAVDAGEYYIILFLDPECGSDIFSRFIYNFMESNKCDIEFEEEIAHIISKLSYDDYFLEEEYPILFKAKTLIKEQ